MAEPPAAAARVPTWNDLGLYLLGGFGLFALSAFGLARLVQEVTIGVSLTFYSLNFVCFAGAAYLFGVRRPGLTWQAFGLRPFARQWLTAALAVAFALIPVRAASAWLVQVLLGGGPDAMQPRLDIVIPHGSLGLNFVLTLLGAGLLVPIGEELYFRGLIHGWCRARFPGDLSGRVLFSSGLFALGHFDSLGVVVSSFFLGVICAVALERSRSLWLPIVIHIVNNGVAIFLVYVALAGQPA